MQHEYKELLLEMASGRTNMPKRTEKNLIVCSGISEAETTNNKRLRSTNTMYMTRMTVWVSFNP